MSGKSQAKPGGAAVPRGRRNPSAIEDAGRKDRAAQQHRPTSPAQEAALPYRAAGAPSIARQESAQTGQGSALHKSSPLPLEGEERGEVPPLRFVDLFCGIGGFRLTFERSGGQCIFSSDWNPQTQITYAADFPPVPVRNIL